MSRAQRFLELMQVLRRHRSPVRAEDLARELDVSVRSVYRDIKDLRAQGAAIDGEAGVGYVLRPGFVLPPLMFSADEVEALVLGLRLAAVHGDSALARAADDASAKIRAVLSAELRALSDDTALLVPQGERPAEAIDLAEVRRAIRAQHKLALTYRDKLAQGSERVVWPFALGFFERVRVVVAFCELRSDYRTFRTDRFERCVVLDERYPRARSVMLAEFRARDGLGPAAAAPPAAARPSGARDS